MEIVCICAARRIHRNAKTGKKRECEGTAIEELRVLTTEAHFKRTLAMHTWAERHIYLHLSQWICRKVSAPSIPNARICTENSPIHFSSRIIFPRLYSTRNPIWKDHNYLRKFLQVIIIAFLSFLSLFFYQKLRFDWHQRKTWINFVQSDLLFVI